MTPAPASVGVPRWLDATAPAVPAASPPCAACGHADHRPLFGCVESTLDADGETWLGCACNLEAPAVPVAGEEAT